jgi:hypothetical protein
VGVGEEPPPPPPPHAPIKNNITIKVLFLSIMV